MCEQVNLNGGTPYQKLILERHDRFVLVPPWEISVMVNVNVNHPNLNLNRWIYGNVGKRDDTEYGSDGNFVCFADDGLEFELKWNAFRHLLLYFKVKQ